MNGRRRWAGTTLLVLLVTALLTGCGSGADTPQITHVRPSTAAPGSLVLVSGRSFERADIVWLNGQPAHQVTWVNARLLTAVVPEGLSDGAYPLEVRSLDGRRTAVSLNVSGGPAAPSIAPPVTEVTPSPAPAAAPAVPMAPAPSPAAATSARPQPPTPVVVSGGTTAAQQQADERQREAQKKAEERLREEQKKAEERQREAEKKRDEQRRR